MIDGISGALVVFQTHESFNTTPSYPITDSAGSYIQIPDSMTEDFRYFRPEQMDKIE